MKTRGYIDLYLPRKLAYHVKIILASILIIIVWKLFTKSSYLDDGSILMFALLVTQFELFIWLGAKFFTNISYATPNEYIKKALFRLVSFFLVAFIISTIILVGINAISYLIQGANLNGLIPHLLKTESKGFLIGAGSGYLFGSLVFFYVQWVDELKNVQKLKEEKLVFQYETLKNQVNPHFLFNSLNTLSSLVSKDLVLSENYIQKLSSIYRYILENKDHDQVSLEKEVKFVKDYFYLQKVRDDGKIDVEIDVQDPEKYLILPISLQLLVENAFKHNVSTRENPLIVEIKLNQEEKIISVSNNLKPKTQIEESSKIGLANLAERNKLITGREIIINQSETQFIVQVPLKLNNDESTNN